MADPAVWITGTGPDKQLNFRLPTGGKGDKGDKGDKGADGANVLPTDTAIKDAIANPASATRGELNATFARNATIFELVSNWAYGHSYTQAGFVPDAAKFHARVARRLGTQPVTINGVSGYKMQQAAVKAVSTWTAGSRGLVMLTCLVNDVYQYDAASTGPATTAASLKAFLSLVSAGVVIPASTSPFSYSAGWVGGTGATGRAAYSTTTVGSYVDVTFTGDAADLSVNLSAAAGGVITATMGGSTVGTLNTNGFFESAPGVLSLAGLGSGSHTVRFTFTSGVGISLDALYVRNPNPPTIVVYQEGWIPNMGTVDSARNTLLTSTYPAACAPVLAAFPNVVTVKADSGWDPPAMLIADQIHPNEVGHSYIAGRIVSALLGLSPREGQNVLVGAGFAYAGTTGGTAAGLPRTPIVDNFNRANNTGGLGTTSDGRAVWTNVSLTISSNTALGTGGGGTTASVVDYGFSDAVVQVTVLDTSGNGGPVGRWSDQSNFWFANIVGGVWTIQKKVAGTISTATGGTSSTAHTAGAVMALEFSGTTITLKKNGTQIAQVTGDSFNQTATRYGMYNPNGGNQFDDFSVS